MGRKKKEISPNYQLMLDMAIQSLRYAYIDYKRALQKEIGFSGVDHDGNFWCLSGFEERNKKLDELRNNIIRIKFKVDELKDIIESGQEPYIIV